VKVDAAGATAAAGADLAVPVVVTARSAQALQAQAARLGAMLEADADAAPTVADVASIVADVGQALASARAVFSHRAVVVARDRAALARGLAAIAAGNVATLADSGALAAGPADAPKTTPPRIAYGVASEPDRAVFVFPGEGAQWAGMGAELLAGSPVFAAHMAACGAALAPFIDWELVTVVRAGAADPAWNRLDVVQPVLWATMVSLAAVWRSLGVEPAAVIGHTQGEIAAATVAGALTLGDAARVVTVRSRQIQRLAQLDQISDIRDAVVAELAAIRPRPAAIAFYSTVGGAGATPGAVTDTTALDGAYWYRNLSEPAVLPQVVAALAAAGQHHYVELSPHPLLTEMVEQALGEARGSGAIVGSLRRGDGSLDQLLRSVGEAFVHGVAVDWAAAFAGRPRDPRVTLPSYPFQRRRYWLSAVAGAVDIGAAGLEPGQHPLLGAAVWLADGGGLLLTGRLGLDATPWLADHAVRGELLVPGTALVELALAAARRVGAARVVDDLTIQAPMIVPRIGEIQIQVMVGAGDESGRRSVEIYWSVDGAAWTQSASGVLGSEASDGEWLAVWPPAGAEPVDLSGAYAALLARGLGYGPAFQGLRRAWRLGDDVYADVSLPESVPAAGYGLHPALSDAVLHALVIAGLAGDGVQVPFSFTGVTLHATASPSQLRAKLTRRGEAIALALADDTGAPVATVASLVLRPVR
jgi:acyl transferase domain-containing protein